MTTYNLKEQAVIHFKRTFMVMATVVTGLIGLLWLLTIAPTALATPGVIYVNAQAAGPTHNGTSWATAYTNLQAGLNSAVAGDEIWVAQGIYTPTQGVTRTATFALKPGVALYGGFAATETVRSQRDWVSHVTVLSGDLDGNDHTDVHGVVTTTANITGNNAYNVVTGSGLTATARLDGFTITAGDATSSFPHDVGGGLHNVSGSSPTLENDTFSGNHAVYGGGGMSNDLNNTTALINVTFSGNSCDYFGGGLLNYGSPTLTGVTFVGNQALLPSWGSGGGMYNNHAPNPSLTNVVFNSNTAVSSGGGLYNDLSSPSLTNVTFNDNTATVLFGGGIDNEAGPLTLNNVTFQGNHAADGGGLYSFSSTLTLNNVTFNANAAFGFGGGADNEVGINGVMTHVIFSGNSAGDGGGLANDISSPIMTDITFSANSASHDGGGMDNINGSNPKLNNVHFSSNSANYGGGIYNRSSNPTLTDVSFIGNSAKDVGSSGGGVDNETSTPNLINVLISGNSANLGGGLYNYASSPNLVNVTLSSNYAYSLGVSVPGQGGGLFNDSNSHPRMVNSILWGDSAETAGPEIFNADGASSAAITYSDVQWPGSVYTGTGNIEADPLFVAPITATVAPTVTGNYRLQPGSPAINAGNNLSVTVSTDLDGHPRIIGGEVDLGAYESANRVFLPLIIRM